MKIESYKPSRKAIWDVFVKTSKNGTFLFLRDYMDYHHDRFQDHSLLIWDSTDKLIALLPANRDGRRLASHGGLTYGGFITDVTMKTPMMLDIFDEVQSYLKQNSFSSFIYKTIPHVYPRIAAEEDRYALFLCNAKLVRRGVLTVIDSRYRLPFQERRRRGVKKALKNNLQVRISDDFESYWLILSAVLMKTFQTLPVHCLEEIRLLYSRFPENIKLFSCFQADTMLAGVVVYESDQVARSQYIAASDLGRELGALDLVFDFLLGDVYRAKPFFDFGTSDEQDGRCLNRGLIDQKEGFGARAVMQDHYEIDLSNWQPGQLRRAME